jgi:hypothetical protein
MTNEAIFEAIKEAGMITEQQIKLLKLRSNRLQKDVMDYELIEQIDEGYGIPVTEEQGAKGLEWLRKFARMRYSPLGYREIDIINHAEPSDFRFRGFYQSGYGYRNFLPIYELNGMAYVPMAEPYVIG